MTARQLFDYAQKYGFEDIELFYPGHKTECDLENVTLAKTLVSSDVVPNKIILLSIWNEENKAIDKQS